MVANQSALPGRVPIMLCSSGRRGACGKLRQPGDHRAGIDHEGHDVDHHAPCRRLERRGSCAASKARPKRSSRASASRSIGLATEASGGSRWRSTSASGLGRAPASRPSSDARGRRTARPDRPELDRISARLPRPLREAAERLGRASAGGAGSRPGRCRRRRRRRRWRHRRWLTRRYGPPPPARRSGAAAEQGDHRLVLRRPRGRPCGSARDPRSTRHRAARAPISGRSPSQAR